MGVKGQRPKGFRTKCKISNCPRSRGLRESDGREMLAKGLEEILHN